MKKFLLRSLKWIGAFFALLGAGFVWAEIYNQFQLAKNFGSYQSGWHFVAVFTVIVPISVLSGIIALFGNMKRFTSSPLRIWTVSSQGMMFFLWFLFIVMVLVS